MIEWYIQWTAEASQIYGDIFNNLNIERQKYLELRETSNDNVDWFTNHLNLQEAEEKTKLAFIRFLGVHVIRDRFYEGASQEELHDMLEMWLQI